MLGCVSLCGQILGTAEGLLVSLQQMSASLRAGAKARPSPSSRWQQRATLGRLCPFLSYPDAKADPGIGSPRPSKRRGMQCRGGPSQAGTPSSWPLGQHPKVSQALLVYPRLLQLCSAPGPRPWLTLGALAAKHRNCSQVRSLSATP